MVRCISNTQICIYAHDQHIGQTSVRSSAHMHTLNDGVCECECDVIGRSQRKRIMSENAFVLTCIGWNSHHCLTSSNTCRRIFIYTLSDIQLRLPYSFHIHTIWQYCVFIPFYTYVRLCLRSVAICITTTSRNERTSVFHSLLLLSLVLQLTCSCLVLINGGREFQLETQTDDREEVVFCFVGFTRMFSTFSIRTCGSGITKPTHFSFAFPVPNWMEQKLSLNKTELIHVWRSVE